MTAFSKQTFKSEQKKWFQYQKDTTVNLMQEYVRSNSSVKFSIGSYAGRTAVLDSFSQYKTMQDTISLVNQLEVPSGNSQVKDALTAALNTMFTAAAGSRNTSQKVLIVFIERGLDANSADVVSLAKQLRKMEVKMVVVLASTPLSDNGIKDLIGDDGDVVVKKSTDDFPPDLATAVKDLLDKGMLNFNFLYFKQKILKPSMLSWKILELRINIYSQSQ